MGLKSSGDLFWGFRQIAPVVQNGKGIQVVQVSIISSMYWKDFKSYNLTKDMRLLGITENVNIELTEQQHLFLNNQKCYGDKRLKIGEGRWKGSNHESHIRKLTSGIISFNA